MGSVLEANSLDPGLWYEARSPSQLIEVRTVLQQSLQQIRFHVPQPNLLKKRDALLLASFALALHVGGVYWFNQRPTSVLPEVPVQIPPMIIEFSSPVANPAANTPPPPSVPPVVTPPPAPAVDEVAAKKPPKPTPKLKVTPPPQPPKPKAEAKPVEPKPVRQEPTTSPMPTPPVASTSSPAPTLAPPSLTPPSATAGYLRNPAPEYPALAQRRGWEGRVLLRVRVLASGKPSEIQIQKSSGRDLLDEAAIQAVQRWSFVPAKRGDVAQEGWVSVPIDFKLH